MKACIFARSTILLTLLFFGANQSPAQERPSIRGQLEKISDDKAGENPAYSCVLDTTGELFGITLNPTTQMIEIRVPREATTVRGIATFAQFRSNEQDFESYYLSSGGSPFFYNFTFMSNLTTGRIALQLVHNAQRIECEGDGR